MSNTINTASKDFPNDVESLKQIILELQKENENLKKQVQELLHRLTLLTNEKFGKKSEKFKDEENDVDDDEGELSETETITYTRKKPSKPKGRKPIPDDLPRIDMRYELPEDQTCDCGCGSKLRKIGEEISEQLEIIPKLIFVKRYIRYKYAGCPNSNKVQTAPMPRQPIDKGLAGPGLLADVLIKKYDDHLPLYRQSEILARHKINISRSTLCGWVAQCAFLLEPIVKIIQKDLLKSPKIHTDDTTVPVQEKNKTKTGRIWIYATTGTSDPPIAVYEYTPTRSQQGPLDFLKEYEGYLQADAYAGYDALYKNNIIEVGCMAHARRKFVEATKGTKEIGAPNKALRYIRELYKVEEEAKDLDDESRRKLRLEKSKPILEEFKQWLETKKIVPKTAIGKAITYTLNQWEALTRYLDHGMLSIDNNFAERLIKPIVIGRKNWLFAGSDKGAANAAIIYSLIETCKLNNVNPYEYLRDVLTRLPTQLNNNIRELLPYNWEVQEQTPSDKEILQLLSQS